MSVTTKTTTLPSPTATDSGEAVAHLGDKNQVTEAYVMGTPIKAMCGITFVPSRNPDGFPICQGCIDAVKRYRSRYQN